MFYNNNNSATWGMRGWCRLERVARELSADSTWILIQSSTMIEVCGTVASFPSGCVGEGEFTKQEDCQKLAPVMKTLLMNKLYHCLRSQDLPSFRRHMQCFYFRGLGIKPVSGLLPDLDADSDGLDVVRAFLHQNGFERVGKADTSGWAPLHYAALSGNMEVIHGLLQQQVDVNRRTSKSVPALGTPPWMSALDIAILYKQHEAARYLISAGARLKGGVVDAVILAAGMDDVEGMRLLCAAGSPADAKNIFGMNTLEAAAAYGALSALEFVVLHSQPRQLELSKALWVAMNSRCGSADVVQRLVSLGADVNFQLDSKRHLASLARLAYGVKSLQFRLGGSRTLLFYYHAHKSTPLMSAVRSAQYQLAAVLIASGANLELRNCRRWTAADFAKGADLPAFLQRLVCC